MNVLKQDAMDDKIIERCKICENQCMQEGLDRLEVVELLSRENPEILMDQGSVKNLSSRQWAQKFSSMDRGSVEITRRRLNRKDICRGCDEELSSLKKRGFSRREKLIEMNA